MKRKPATPATYLKVLVWGVFLTPLVWLAYQVRFGDGLGANPIEAMTHVTGRWALGALLATLAVTPIRRLTGFNPLIKLRRLLGLWAFAYVSVHFGVYLFDQVYGWPLGTAWEFVLEDIAERTYITAGFTAFVLLIPLAVTSTRGWIRRLGKRWQKLHRLVYVAGVLGVVHFYWKVKADTFWPLVAAALLAVFFGVRIYYRLKGKRSPARA